MKAKIKLFIHKVGVYYRHVIVLVSRYAASLLISLQQKLDKFNKGK